MKPITQPNFNTLDGVLINPRSFNEATGMYPKLKLVGDATGETDGYPIGLVVKIDETKKTCTPLSAPAVAGTDVIGVLLEHVTDLKATETSTQNVAVCFRLTEFHRAGLVLRPGATMESVEKALFKQNNIVCPA